ncbi:hypothetical protein FRUB_09755 [Fimbriiglobus ruber]|uniref:Uncharacterized protein n=1 Tax=Fimbriiglobus ruber TaxID=1908690 RepID=A0A225D1W0_9BACT|nr:hypothetical protein FRUB_09755 [Fimbriiglobus ruber]
MLPLLFIPPLSNATGWHAYTDATSLDRRRDCLSVCGEAICSRFNPLIFGDQESGEADLLDALNELSLDPRGLADIFG